MKLFSKKAKFMLNSEQQKDDFIEKLESAHIEYDIRKDKDSAINNHPTYIVRIDAADMQKVV